METEIFLALLHQRLSVSFELWGDKVVFLNKADDTPKNQDIVTYVRVNYNTLAEQYIAKQLLLKQAEEAKIAAKEQAIADIIPTWSQTEKAIASIDSMADVKNFLLKLTRIVYWIVKNKPE